MVYRPWASGPGEFLIVDFGEVGKVETAAGRRTLSCFCAVLGWSRWRYVRFFTCQRFQVLAQGLAGCFEAMGGVSAKVMFDNPKTVTDYFVMGLSVLLCRYTASVTSSGGRLGPRIRLPSRVVHLHLVAVLVTIPATG